MRVIMPTLSLFRNCKPMPPELKREMFDSIESRLDSYMEGRIFPEEIATTFNYIVYDEFEKTRKVSPWSLAGYSLMPVFVGEYKVDVNYPYQTRVFSHQGTEACSPLKFERGVIGRAVRKGLDQYVSDVTKDPDHVGCDPKMQGSELVLLSWSDPYSSGPYAQRIIPLGVLDIDLNIKETFSATDIRRLRKIWDRWGKLIFPGEPTFLPKKEAYRSLQEYSLAS